MIEGLNSLVLAASKLYPGNDTLQAAVRTLRTPPPEPREDTKSAKTQGKDCPDPDVFLSYASPDWACAIQLAEALTQRRKRVWIDRWCLSPGRNFIGELDSVLRQVRSFAILLGPAGINPWHRMEIYSALSMYVETPSKVVVPILIKGFPRGSMPVFLTQFSFVELETCQDVQGLDRLVRAL